MLKPPIVPDPMPRRPGAREQALERATFALQMQQPAEAARIAEEVLKTNRTDSAAIQLLSHALMLQGRTDEAIARLDKAARRNENPRITTLAGCDAEGGGTHDEALDRLRRAAAQKPAFPPAFLELGRQLSALNRHGEAIEMLQRGLALAPDAADLLFQLGSSYLALNERSKARAAFMQVLAQAPDRLDVVHALAHVLQAEGEVAEAAEKFRQVLAVRPDHAAARIGLGVCLLELRQPDEALLDFRRAVRANPNIYSHALNAAASTSSGRFWLRPSDAARTLGGKD